MHGMLQYFIRRILLIPVTFVVITFMVYAIMRLAPGGPIEQLERQMKMAAAGEAGGGPAGLGGDEQALDEEDKEELRRYYNLDSAIPIGYLEWLGVKPRIIDTPVRVEERQADPEFWSRVDTLWVGHRGKREAFEELLQERDWLLQGGVLLAPVDDTWRARDPDFFGAADALLAGGPSKRKKLEQLLETKDHRFLKSKYYGPVTAALSGDPAYHDRVVSARTESDESLAELETFMAPQSYVVRKSGKFYRQSRRFSGILEGDFGRSFQYTRPALDVIFSKFPISIYFGLIGYFSAWLVCVPLGAFKAILHRSHFDTASSVAIFAGYSIPGFVACMLLLIVFGGGTIPALAWVPLGGFRDPNWDAWWESGQYWRCIKDQVHHTIVPVFGYLVGSFATMTVLMKNSLLENLGADYVRTAFAKGLPEKRVIFIHAMRNSLIPLTATIGYALGILFAGSFLIEFTCNIPGMGLLAFESIQQRDYPIMLGSLVFLVLIRLTGNIISDLVWAVIDPRIRFR